MPHHQGQCHCGNIRYIFETGLEIEDMVLRQCDCSFCRKNGGRYTSDPRGALSVTITDKEKVASYRFGHKTADFIFCRICGVMPFITCRLENKTFAVLNVNTLDQASRLSGDLATMHFDGEEKLSRLARRQKNWIGSVTYL